MKTRIGSNDAGDRWLMFWCPGCDEVHGPKIAGAGAWTFNGDRERPTVEPSILVTGTRPLTGAEYQRVRAGETIEPEPRRCHSFLRDGRLQFLGDCTHALAGQTVDLPEWPYAEGAFGGVDPD